MIFAVENSYRMDSIIYLVKGAHLREQQQQIHDKKLNSTLNFRVLYKAPLSSFFCSQIAPWKTIFHNLTDLKSNMTMKVFNNLARNYQINTNFGSISKTSVSNTVLKFIYVMRISNLVLMNSYFNIKFI